MSRQRVVIVVGVLVVALVLLTVWWRRDPQDDARHPLLVAMLAEPAKEDRDHGSVFFRSLSALAGPQGFTLDRQFVEGDAAPIRQVDEGYAIRVRSGRHRYVVAVLRGWDDYIPGYDTQYLLLFSPDGELLDTLSCSVNARLTRMFVESGTFRTDVIDPETDVRLALRYVPEPGGRIAGNWHHAVTHRGVTRQYVWEHSHPWASTSGMSLRTADMEQEGLCRVAIRDGRFAVVFPERE